MRHSAFDTYSTALAAWAGIEYLVQVRGTVIGPPVAFCGGRWRVLSEVVLIQLHLSTSGGCSTTAARLAQ
jgi:hypothetical protein